MFILSFPNLTINQKQNNMSNENETQNQSLAIAENQSISEFTNELGFTPRTQEEFEMVKMLLDSAAALDGLELPRVTSTKLADSGEIFDIVDATVSTINAKVKTPDGEIIVPKQVVTFLIESSERELTAVMKDGHSINLQYVTFFSNFKAIGKPQRKTNMTFVEATWLPKISGNYPIILRKAANVVKQVSGKK